MLTVLALAVLAWFFYGFSKQIQLRLKHISEDVQALRARIDVLEGLVLTNAKPVVPPTDAATAAAAEVSGQVEPSPASLLSPVVAQPPAMAEVTPSRPVAPTPPAQQPTRRKTCEETETLETRIGSRWLLYVGVVAIVIGVSYFVKLAFDNEWIDEVARVTIGAFAGTLLLYAGARFRRAGFPLYGQMITGGGIAILYVSIYSAFNFYSLISHPAAFALMCSVTVAAAWLASQQQSQGLALMAVGGGFATPWLMATGRDAQIALFTYDVILVAGTMYLAHRREWPGLNLISYSGTVLTVVGWAARFYTSEKFLITEIILTVFCGMFLFILRENRRAVGPLAVLVQLVLWTAPILYYLASLAILYEHSIPMLVYLILLTLAGAVIARQIDSSLIRLIAWLAVEAPLAVWLNEHRSPGWFVAGLAVVAGVYALTLVGQLEVVQRKGQRLDATGLVLLHLNGLVTYGLAYWLIDSVESAATAPAAFLFASWHGALALGLARRDRQDALHLAAIALTLIAIAVALAFDGAWVTVAWAAEGAAVVWLGLRERRVWLRAAGLMLLTVAAVRLLELQFSQPPIGQGVLLNQRAACSIFVVGLMYVLARLYRLSIDRAAATPPRSEPPNATTRALLLVAANLLTLSWLTGEITSFWQLRELVGRASALSRSGHLVREVMLSITWSAYATLLILVGLRRQYAPIRYFAIVVFAITILKVFTVDLAALERIYRVLSIVGLGVLLLMSSYLYQRTRVVRRGLAEGGSGLVTR
jgi:uncharacterized membrane protein